MIEKIITPQEFDVPGVNVIMPSEAFGVKCASRDTAMCNGGPCTVKQANDELKSFIQELKPDPKYLYLHIIALGSGEYFGANTNGDYFPEEGLLRKHDTFCTHAKHYKHHINKDPRISYGHPVFSTYNHPMHRVELILATDREKAPDLVQSAERGEHLSYSMSCFPGGAPVLMADGSEMAIEQVPVGSSVITHTGDIGITEQSMQRDYDGPAISFRAYGLPDELFCTANHKIWTRPIIKGKQKCPVCCEKFKSLKAHMRQRMDTKHQYAYRNYEKYAEGMIRADDLCHGDYVRTPFDTTVTERGDDNYADILGYYLAEGHIFINSKYESNHCVDFTFHIKEDHYVDELLVCLKKAGCNRMSVYRNPEHNRQIVRVRDKEMRERLLKDANRLSYKLCLSQEIMTWEPATQLRIFNKYINGDGDFNKINKQVKCTTTSRRLAFQLAAIAWRNNVSVNIHRYIPKLKTKRLWYSVTIAGSDLGKFTSDKIPTDLIVKTEYATKVGHLKHQPQGLTVVRKVAKKLSYVENGYVYRRIHRVCQKHYTGKVYNIAVSGDSSYVVNGVAVSNCRIPFDVCSVCSNKARTKREYCSHIKNQLLEILPDGRQVYMINPDPTFFDISYVLRPADKTARMISKVAGCHMAAKPSQINKGSSIKKEIDVILTPMLPKEQQDTFVKDAMPLLMAAEPELPMDSFGEYPLKDILSTLSLCGIICRPKEYNRIMIVKKISDPENVRYSVSSSNFNDDMYSMIKDIVPQRSFYCPHVISRLQKIASGDREYIVRGVPGQNAEPLVTDKRLLTGLGIAGGGYAVYRTQFGQRLLANLQDMIENRPGKFWLIAGLGALTAKTLPILGRRPVTDSLIVFDDTPHIREGVIVDGFKHASTHLRPATAEVIKQSMQPFGLLFARHYLE